MTLPSFLFVGAMKRGTTTLHEVLGQHPEVLVTRHQELHCFDRKYELGPQSHEAAFTPTPGQTATGGSTPGHMWDPPAWSRLIADLPDVRVLVMLRDPAKRTYSHYWHSRERGREEVQTLEATDGRDRMRVVLLEDLAVWLGRELSHWT